MAIVKYTFKNGQFPSGITDHGYFKHPVDKTLIGIGDAGGTDSAYKTELTKDQLIAYVKTLPNLRFIEMSTPGYPSTITTNRNYTNAELETIANDWCTAKGIS
tara:strand:+ start:2944 stop:3252 length:309 start_codon:yes stop_codon:yes gene_type:complete